jgi:PAS domain S-box-containing protein
VEQRTSELLESEARSWSILQVALDGFWIIDRNGRILNVNSAYCRMSGYSSKELMQMSVQDLETVQTDDEVLDYAKKVLEGESAHIETIHRRKDGSLLYIDLVAQNLPGSEDKLFAFIRDITAQKQAEKEKEKLQEQLAQAQKMESVGRLAGGVAHDFNNMLGVILGHTEMAMDQLESNPSVKDDLEEIRKAAQRSADLTRQLLAFARKQTIAPKVLDLNDTVTGMLKMLQRLIGEDIHLSWQPGASLWPVKMDPSQIDQILANLCINARDAITGVGRIGIQTKNVTCDEISCDDIVDCNPGSYVLLTVNDNGSGIDPEIMTQIFEPFFTTKPQGQGTGLGLATVYGIIKQNRGFINVKSEKDKGTAFEIYMPRYSGVTSQSTTKFSAAASGGHETILLVEDEPAILKMVGMMLERLGYTVLSAASPGEAIRLSNEYGQAIHLLMTDVIMP